MKMLRCPVCRVLKPVSRRSKACSKKCAAVLVKRERGEDVFREFGRRAGARSRVVRRAQMEARWQAEWPGVPIEIARRIYAVGYNSGWRKGTDHGYRKGWADACGDAPERPAKVRRAS